MVKSEYQLLYDAWKQAHPGISDTRTEKVQNRNKQMTVSSWIKDHAGQRRESQQPPAASRSEEPADPRETESVCIEEVDAVRPAQARKSLAQEKLKDDLYVVIAEIARIEFLKNTRFITDQDKVKIKVLKKNEAKLHAQLKRLQTVARNSRTYRMTRKLKLKELSIKYPELASEINANIGNRPGSGRPRLEESQHLLLKTIVDIVAPEASTDQRRRSELLNSCKTLDDLQKELARQGFHISKSALYLRLLPRNSSTTEGKRHVKTVPVRLLRADKTKMKSHSDAHFAATTILHLRELAETMGQECCFILSQDDKARILLGLPAANIQSPILMHMSYRVTLPDHDWVVAPGHKLIPSVYAGLDFDKRKLSYSGPTYIGIRSGKHDSSTAFSHACDFRRLIDLNEFKCLAKIPGSGEVKPIIIVFTDGGPDENHRFPKTLLEYAKHFNDFDLDAIFVACHAPGQSAYNQVERRMAPLLRDLSGIILPL
ncbi:unnamed protein product [Allacma fusca]|uniref:Uncharacterized protein n=1 Tax=Allacma fusca TaxID=39272 RepID=A0A8J2LBA8_9HEXA|nr:unnamed protein product [Allacma fusca]